MNVTETALKQTDMIFTNIKENLTAGASDNHTANDRQKILESLKGLRAELYSSGNADYAERTVFTGYRTGESLTFLETDKDLNVNYLIHETFNADSVEQDYTYITSSDINASGTIDETDVKEEKINRIRLAYGDVKNNVTGIKLAEADPTLGPQITVVTQSLAGKTQKEIDDIYTRDTTPAPSDNVAYLIPETGELILSTTAANAIIDQSKAGKGDATFEYNKDQWKSGDLRPEHYFACVQGSGTDLTYFNYDLVSTTGKPNPSKPNFKNQDMEVEISFNQKITINTHANEVYTHDIGRDIDELITVTQSVVDADNKITELEGKVEKGTATQQELDAAKKEYALKKDKMQKMFSAALDTFEGYADRNNVAIANIGSLQSRLTITKERVADQLQSFKELADANINAELTESSIDFASAKLALEAAQLAAGKIAQQTLLNYL